MHLKTKRSLLLCLRRLWLHIDRRRRIQLGVLALLMIVASVAEIVSIGAVVPFLAILTSPERVFKYQLAQPFIQWFGFNRPEELLLPITVVFCVVALVSGGLRLALFWTQTRISHAIGADLSTSIYRRTLYQPYAVHISRNSSDVIAGVWKASTVVGSTILPLLMIISSALTLVAILTTLIAVDATVAFSLFGGFGIIYAMVILLTRRLALRNGERISREQNQVLKALQEGLGGIRDVLIDGAQTTYSRIYQNADLPMRRAMANVQIISSVPRYVLEALGMVLIAVLALFLVTRSGNVTGAIPILGVMALGAQRMLPAFQQVYSNWIIVLGGEAATNDVLGLLDQQFPEHVSTPSTMPISFKHIISLNNLWFRYSSESPPVIKGVSFNIAKGSRVGIVGHTGSGKSTLLDIIMGLLDSTEGCIEIDGVPITPQNQRAWQAHIAHVPQTIFLADTTIAENIAFGIPPGDIDFDLVRRAAQKAQIANTIELWNSQYHTLVGERGVRLSGGQRQRIGVARALYRRADVLVLDEATSALDNETESTVMRAVEGLDEDLTILIVAHRLTTLQKCSQVIELRDGQVKRIGTYSDICSDKREM